MAISSRISHSSAKGGLLHKIASSAFSLLLVFSMLPVLPSSAWADEGDSSVNQSEGSQSSEGDSSSLATLAPQNDEGEAPQNDDSSVILSEGAEGTEVEGSQTDAGDSSASPQNDEGEADVEGDSSSLATLAPQNDEGAADADEGTVQLQDDGDATTAWDGSTIDTSWYNTTDTTFTISTAAQLAGLAAITTPTSYDNWAAGTKDSKATGIKVDDFYGKTVKLTADIDLGNQLWYPISDICVPGVGGQGVSGSTYDGVAWRGTFDGGGHTVSNMNADGTRNNGSANYYGYQGLFSAIGVGGLIRNVGVTGTISARCGGGIVGVSNTESSDTLTTSPTEWPRIENCWTKVSISSNGSGSRGSGGIFGGEHENRAMCSIVNCYALGTVNGQINQSGGISGQTNGIVAGCYFVGSVSGGYEGAICSNLYLPSASSTGSFKAIGTYLNNMALDGSADNVYRYQDSFYGNPVEVTEGFSTADEIKAGAVTLGSGYTADTNNINNGYPVLFWQAGLSEIDISGATVAAIPDQDYTGVAIEPELTVTKDGTTLVQNLDYVVEYTNNVDVGTNTATATVHGIGRYTGTLATVNFSIVQLDLSTCTIDPIPNKWGYGDPVEPTLTVKDSDGNTLTEGTDYTVAYTNNVETGQATATISSVGVSSTGTKSINFYVERLSVSSLQGSGTETDPYQISTRHELQFVSHMVNTATTGYPGAYYKLTADIDATSTETQAAFEQIGIRYTDYDAEGNRVGHDNYFYGTFDGDGHTITLALKPIELDSTQTLNSSQPTALFGYVGNPNAQVNYAYQNPETYWDITIKNLTVAGSVKGRAAAGIVGSASYCYLYLENCTNKAQIDSFYTISGQIYGNNAAGLVNSFGYGTIKGCTNEGKVSGANYVGGIVAQHNSTSWYDTANETVVIEDCVNKGEVGVGQAEGVEVISSRPSYAAGILAWSQLPSAVSINRCANTGTIGSYEEVTDATSGKTTAYAPNYSGGIAARLTGTSSGTYQALSIDSSYNTGDVISSQGSGGILGIASGRVTSVTNCYNTGRITVTGTNATYGAGGLVGGATEQSSTFSPSLTVSGYNAGTITATQTNAKAGALLGVANCTNSTYPRTVSLEGRYIEGINSYNTGAGTKLTVTDNSQALSSDNLKTAASDIGRAFYDDKDNINQGYPVLYWQTSASASDISNATISTIEDQTYTGSAITPTPTVTLSGETLSLDSDYVLTYENNVNAGTATVIVTGKGLFAGSSKNTTFTIERQDIAGAAIAAISDVWAGGAAIPATPALTITSSYGATLVAGTDYTVAYASNTATGTATATITGTGNYKGTTSATFEVVSTTVESLSGSGTTADPYLISNKDELEFFALGVNNGYKGFAYAAFKMTADVDASKSDGRLPVDTIGTSTSRFSGIFDGDGHTVTLGLSSATNGTAMFSRVDGAHISNITTAGSVSGSSYVAGLVGIAYGSLELSNCTNTATVAGASPMAGLVGYVQEVENLKLSDCVNEGSVTATGSYVGGLVGSVTFKSGLVGSIELVRCENHADVSSSNTSSGEAGGIVARIYTSNFSSLDGIEVSFEECANTGSVRASKHAGGILGNIESALSADVSFTNVYNTGAVSQITSTSRTRGAGGIIGHYSDYGNVVSLSITNGYSSGAVTKRSSNTAGAGAAIGLYEYGKNASIANFYYDTNDVASAVGRATTSGAVSDLSTAVSDDELKATGDEGMAAKLGDAFYDDVLGANSGYPVFEGSTDSVSDYIVAAIPVQTYTGAAIEPSVRVIGLSGAELTQGEDFDVAFEDNIEVGTAKAIVIGIGSYTGTAETTFQIAQCKLSDCTVAPIEDQTATGEALTPALTVTNAAGALLVPGIDYKAYYFNNVEIGTARVTLVGAGNYTDSAKATFKIVAGDIADATVTGIEDFYDYTGEAITITPVVTLGETVLTQGTDYTFAITDGNGNEVSEVKDKGSYTATVTGTGLYTGSESITFTVGTYFTVYTQEGASGTPTVVKEYNQAEFEALKATGEAATDVSMLAYRRGSWNVYSSNNYVTVSSILTDAGISDQFVDGTSLSIGAYGDFMADGTWQEYQNQNQFFPEMKSDSTGLDNPRTVEAVIALEYGSSSIADGQTAGEVESTNLANQSTDSCPRLLRGVSAEQVNADSKPGGNRSPQGCNCLILITPEPVYFTLYVQKGEDGERTVAKAYTKSELEALQSASEDPVSGLYYKSGGWKVTTAATYVTLKDLFADAGITDLWKEGAKIRYGGDPLQGKTESYFEYTEFNRMNMFYPEAQTTGTSTTGGYEIPAVLALTEYSASTTETQTAEQIQAENVKNANSNNEPRVIYGVSEVAYLAKSFDGIDGYGRVAGNRYWSNTEQITIEVPADPEPEPEPEPEPTPEPEPEPEPAPTVETQEMLRLYNPNTGEHFYTASTVERDSLEAAGWTYEGVAWMAPKTSDTPVYRLYNPNAGDHHYTTSEAEKNSLESAGWSYEGIGWYSADSTGTPLYRLYNPNAVTGAHHYTVSTEERDTLNQAGWQDEGIGWYGI